MKHRRPTLYTLSLHDALPIFADGSVRASGECRRPHRLVLRKGLFGEERPGEVQVSAGPRRLSAERSDVTEDRKSTRLNSSHPSISYAVFGMKKRHRNQLLVAL